MTEYIEREKEKAEEELVLMKEESNQLIEQNPILE